ncbi:MAG: hypothetical protein JWO00_669 [Candidatus Parcubacteria bacterium]|nr:hypothetical protein [Candidatus Parcubacteria bacterium]
MESFDDEKSETLFLLRDNDVFANLSLMPRTEWQDRITAKAVVFNERNEIALIGNAVHDLLLLPGGGIDAEESVINGLRRECLEEIGYHVSIDQFLGKTEDFRSRDGRHTISYGYVARTESQAQSDLTDNEKSVGTYVAWVSFSEALKRLKLQQDKIKQESNPKFYNSCFNAIRDYFFLQRTDALLGK